MLTATLANEIKQACNACSNMSVASKQLGLSFTTFKRYAQQLGVYVPSPNKGRKNHCRLTADEILVENRCNDQMKEHVSRLQRALNEKGVKYECVLCFNSGLWCGQELTLQIDHVDGNVHNNRLENLRYLCPNCHSQQQTSCFKGRHHSLETKELLSRLQQKRYGR
jgi:5-methylcytosine-specific restriction endonuclease McrA